MAAQNSMPPAELGGLTFTNNVAPARVQVAQAQDAALMVRIQQLEEQLRSVNGQVEGLTFQLTQMQEIVNRLQEDTEFRFQALEGGAGGKTEAVTQPGGVTQPEALPQTPNVVPQDSGAVPSTVIPEQGVQPLPGEIEFDPTFDDGSLEHGEDELGESSDPLVGTGNQGGIDLTTGQPLNLNYNPSAKPSDNPDADAQFKAGYDALQSGDYLFAEDQFSQFLELYPTNARAAEAASGLGDALIERQAYTDAAEVLFNAFQADQTGPIAPELLLKLGVSLSGAGERETACRTFADLRHRFPGLPPDFTGRLAQESSRAECPPA
ncbi:hypothetical protein [Devosia sp. 2618]|uniref:tetratricopeptide repeat protein n=1 Tax=Devosia sp. 2618 TaxID=3156454 RepID=UPI003395B59A